MQYMTPNTLGTFFVIKKDNLPFYYYSDKHLKDKDQILNYCITKGLKLENREQITLFKALINIKKLGIKATSI